MTAIAPAAANAMFAFTPEHDALRSLLAEFFAATAQLDGGTRWRKLVGELGADEILFADPGEAGLVDAAILAEVAGAHLFDGPILSTAAMSVLGRGEPELAALIDEVRLGNRTVAVAAAAVARHGGPHRTGGGRLVDAVLAPVFDHRPDAYVVVPSGDGVAVVAPDANGATWELLDGLDLTRGVGRLHCTRVEPVWAGGAQHVAEAIGVTDLIHAAELLGVAQFALDGTVAHVRQRVQFGRTIGSFQAVKHRLADMLTQVELTRSAVYAAAWQLGGTDARQAAFDLGVASVLARETAIQVTKTAVQLHGGIAITWEHWAHRYLRRAHAVASLSGGVGAYRRRLAAMIAEGTQRD